MSKPLAIVTPWIGLPSETFIQRHMQELLPKRTVAVAATVNELESNNWNLDCPVLTMNWLLQSGLRGLKIQCKSYIFQAFHPFEWRSTEASWIDVKQFFQEHKVQAIMGEYLDQCFPWTKFSQKLDIPFFGHAHGYDVSRILQCPKWRKRYLRYNDTGGIITVSQASREKLLDLGLQPDKVHVVPCGVEVPASPLKRTEQEVIRCLAVGRMVAKKAPLKTLDAFRQAAEICPSLRLDYVGTGHLMPIVQEFIRSYDLGDKVSIHGGQANEVVKQLMRKADIFLQHSMVDPVSGDEEGLPVAILEAMAHSLPVVSTRHAGIPEAVLNGSTGYLVEEGDSTGMAEHLVMLARDFDLRQRIGNSGWHRAKKHFSWEKEKRELLRILGLNQYKFDERLPAVEY
ncbi:glycosyltransferase family 4 protein [Gloeocapsopsis dulcis]|uniref:Colanic acid biosynthesis glycosyltransferase WcaL n=1 Tax=Gloeocapsopsis dulcis AAB1 = 1H9 TaxID=1433147 RepID=A0A6N8FYT7_9CHRO|nr:glycosyltransferase family 4 protein [Gloeocapsopsis dulcis]MUL37297.1 hypothetical protein [Gloeocapsopsis dulcis AAB1 = 1H9]WNN91101.1 glycosyltransferase family 4 protein [Gloeocapsopsis dulcis]